MTIVHKESVSCFDVSWSIYYIAAINILHTLLLLSRLFSAIKTLIIAIPNREKQ